MSQRTFELRAALCPPLRGSIRGRVGVWDSKVCVPKMARSDVPFVNHLAEVVRSKPGRPVYVGKRHIPPHFGPIRVPYLKGLNC